nr:hypothetical protein [Tanacetum cinerariifolium]
MTSLADKAILSGADNRPPMLEKDMYDSWKSRMELYMLNRQHGRMILESVENGSLLWPTVEEDGVNTKFLNTLPPEWSKFVTDVKLVRVLHTTNVDQLHAYLGQHEYHANEVRLMYERTSDPLALSSPYATQYHPHQYASQAPSSSNLSISYPSNDIQSYVNHNVYMASSLIPQMEYAPTVHQQSEFSSPETRLVVLVFQKGDDSIDAINHMMSFLISFVTSRFPATNNQLRTLSNPRQQATINNGKVTIQPIQGRKNSMTAGSSRPYASGSGGASGKQRIIMCYNCKGEGHMSKQCTKPKRKRDVEWFKDKVLLVQAQANGQVLQEEELEFSGSRDSKDLKYTIALMANLSHYGHDNLAEVQNQDNVYNNVLYQDVQETSTSEQSNILNQSETKITSDSNIISYSQYMNESQYTTVQNLSSHALQDDLILFVIEQLKTQVVNCTKINQDNKNVNEILTAELERYKNQERILKEQKNDDKASASYEQSLEIEILKHTLSEHLKDKESLEQKITLLKNDFQQEES